MKCFGNALRVALAALVPLASTPISAQANCCGETFRLECQTVWEERQVTGFRMEQETVYDTVQVTRKVPVWETEQRERRYTVSKPVQETSVREERFIVQKPVFETLSFSCFPFGFQFRHLLRPRYPIRILAADGR